MKHDCRECEFSFWWDDRMRCNKVKRRIESQVLKGEPVFTNVCSNLNPESNCKYFEEHLFDVILDPWDKIEDIFDETAKTETEEKKEDKDGRPDNAEESV